MKEETKIPEVETNTTNMESVHEGPESKESKPSKRGRKKNIDTITKSESEVDTKSEDVKSEKNVDLDTNTPKEDEKVKDTSNVQINNEIDSKKSNKQKRFVRYPIYVYMMKSKRSPIIGSTSGIVFEICEESTDDWICITCGISGKGKVKGYIYRKDAPII